MPLTQIFKLLPSQLLRRDRVGCLLKEESASVSKERLRRRVEGIEIFSEAQGVELIASLLEGLG